MLESNSILSFDEIEKECEKLRKEGKKICFTNGCFDILHSGHVMYLNKAKKLGDILVMGLNSDASVSRLKGPERPLNKEIDRAYVISGLKAIDYVVIFEEDTPLNLIQKVKPDVLIKGGDYEIKDIVGADFVFDRGGEVITIPFLEGRSTTNIIKKMQK